MGSWCEWLASELQLRFMQVQVLSIPQIIKPGCPKACRVFSWNIKMKANLIIIFFSVYTISLIFYYKFSSDIDDIAVDFRVHYERYISQHIAELEKNPQVIVNVKDSPYRSAESKKVLPAYPIQVAKYHKYYFLYLRLQKHTYYIYSSLLFTLGYNNPSNKFCLFMVGAMLAATFFQYRLRERTKKLFKRCKEISELYENNKTNNHSNFDNMFNLVGPAGIQGISGSLNGPTGVQGISENKSC